MVYYIFLYYLYLYFYYINFIRFKIKLINRCFILVGGFHRHDFSRYNHQSVNRHAFTYSALKKLRRMDFLAILWGRWI